MRTPLVWTLCIACLIPLAAHASRTAEGVADTLGGRVVAELGGREIAFPTLRTEVTGNLQGDIATVTVRQVFENPTTAPLNARYLFPLNKDAAVHAMTMEVSDEIVSARIEKRQAARETFETAKQTGKSAALLEQHRPNMFTQEIANLMPGMPVTITLEYSQVVPCIDGAYELRVPLVVGPRYVPRDAAPQLAGLDLADRPDLTPRPMDDETPAHELPATPGGLSQPPCGGPT